MINNLSEGVLLTKIQAMLDAHTEEVQAMIDAQTTTLNSKIDASAGGDYSVGCGESYVKNITLSSQTIKTSKTLATITPKKSGSLRLIVEHYTSANTENYIYLNGTQILASSATSAERKTYDFDVEAGKTYTITSKSGNTSYASYIISMAIGFNLVPGNYEIPFTVS